MDEMIFHVPNLAWARSAVADVVAAGYDASLSDQPACDGTWTVTVRGAAPAVAEAPPAPAFQWATFVNSTIPTA